MVYAILTRPTMPRFPTWFGLVENEVNRGARTHFVARDPCRRALSMAIAWRRMPARRPATQRADPSGDLAQGVRIFCDGDAVAARPLRRIQRFVGARERGIDPLLAGQ